MQTSHEESSFPIPEKIGSYCIERKLGQGGMGEVFLAFDPICKRRIALKQIRKELCRNDSLQKRFLREALVAAHLSHPSIIPIYSIHKEENAIFYTMPFVEGETLKQIIKTAQEQEQEGATGAVSAAMFSAPRESPPWYGHLARSRYSSSSR